MSEYKRINIKTNTLDLIIINNIEINNENGTSYETVGGMN